MTTLIDIYEAAGFKVTKDRTQVEMSAAQQMRPFDIVLQVVPTGMSFNYEKKETVTFSVVMKDGVWFGDDGRMSFVDYGFEIEMPVDQVRILPPGTPGIPE